MFTILTGQHITFTNNLGVKFLNNYFQLIIEKKMNVVVLNIAESAVVFGGACGLLH